MDPMDGSGLAGKHDALFDLAMEANDVLAVPSRRGRPPSTVPRVEREREHLMPLYGAFQGRKLSSDVAEPFVRRGWLVRGGRRDWLTEAGKAALRGGGFEL